jgi:hypothetical protein
VPEKYAVGRFSAARVTRIAEFGAFVELEPGIEALAHASTFTPAGKSKRMVRSNRRRYQRRVRDREPSIRRRSGSAWRPVPRDRHERGVSKARMPIAPASGAPAPDQPGRRSDRWRTSCARAEVEVMIAALAAVMGL